MVLRIFKTIATSGFPTALECTKFVSDVALPRTPLGELAALPRVAGSKGLTFKAEGERKRRGEGERKGTGGTGPLSQFLDAPLRCAWLLAIPEVNVSCDGRTLSACFRSTSDVLLSPSEFQLQPNCSSARFRSDSGDGKVCLHLDMARCACSTTKVGGVFRLSRPLRFIMHLVMHLCIDAIVQLSIFFIRLFFHFFVYFFYLFFHLVMW